ncbi:MAG TPA: CBS domain-containing protein [Blastocatellia bacterium]|nr:CBS domain-containing protein [Blastocatellia bacterium]
MENRNRNVTDRRDDWDYEYPRTRRFSSSYGRGYEEGYGSYRDTGGFSDYGRGYDETRDRGYSDAYRTPSREGYYGQGALRSHLRCRDIMTRNVTTCRRDTPIYDVARLMRDEDIGAVPVLGADGKLEGIVTDRDIVVEGLTSGKDDTEIRAEDCMSTDLYTANQNERVVDVIREMGDHQVRRVPIVDSRDRLVGIISMADVATQTNKDQELAEALEEISKPGSFLGRVAHWFGF